MFDIVFRSFRSHLRRRNGKYHDASQDTETTALCRKDLEAIFAYELRVANADILKLKVYGKDERFKSGRIVPLGVEHDQSLMADTVKHKVGV